MLAAAQVLDAIAARITGLSLTGAHVFTDRAWPLTEATLPAWKVVSPDEDIEPLTIHTSGPQQHRLQIELQGYVKAAAGIDDAMHAIASQAITALFNEPGTPDALSALAGRVQLSQRRVERAMKSEGQAELGLIQITLRAEFSTLSNAPDTIL